MGPQERQISAWLAITFPALTVWLPTGGVKDWVITALKPYDSSPQTPFSSLPPVRTQAIAAVWSLVSAFRDGTAAVTDWFGTSPLACRR